MDGYAPAFVAHNLPLLVVSGLETLDEPRSATPGTSITSEIPSVESDDAQVLLGHFKANDASDLAWNGREHSRRNKFRVKTIAREYTLPMRHAAPAAIPQPTSQISKPVLHSALSPLTPSSTLYPDGLIDAKWIEKHQYHVPSAYVVFYTFTSNPNLSSKLDNQLKSDINNIKTTLCQSGYKTRLVVALLSENSVVQSPDVEDRLANIRKNTGLDSKTSFFFLPPQSSPVELRTFVDTITSTIYPLCIEYYRDLSKHARRKRNRGIVPPPTAPPTSGTSQTLSSQGWNIRYDFKLGVFSEFRQEMDAAVRSYESGYEGLLGPDVLEAIASWGPRWNEYRLLADVLAIRILRCLLWNGNSTTAVRRWQQHRERIRDFVDRRGKGSSTYGWEAWEARWATIMGEMVVKVSISDFAPENGDTYLPPEKSIAIGERLRPWELLHHPGYWFFTASKHSISRRNLALAMPEEDRAPPGVSPASQIVNKSHTYDDYLCPEPHVEYPLPGHNGFNHSASIIFTLSNATAEFETRGQRRLVQELQLLSAKESMRRELWNDALMILRTLWLKMSYRKEGWWNAVEEVGWALRNAALHAGDGVSVVSVDWELMNNSFAHHPSWHYDITRSLEGISMLRSKPMVVLHNAEVHSFLSATFTFEHTEGKVGDACRSQCTVTSTALPASVPVAINGINIEFLGSMKELVIRHMSDGETGNQRPRLFKEIALTEVVEDGRAKQTGHADLTFRPGQMKVFEFKSSLREDGDVKAVSATFTITSASFDLDYVHTFEQMSTPDLWWGQAGMKKKIARSDASSLTVLPKPPKMELRFIGLQGQYYTNEGICLDLEALNEEDVDAIANLEVSLHGDGAPPVRIVASDKSPPSSPTKEEEGDLQEGTQLGRIASGASSRVRILIPPIDLPAVYELAIKASYNLVLDLETPVSRSITLQLDVINPFEANYDFSPRIHPDPWPSFFAHEEAVDTIKVVEYPKAYGLSQKWCLAARYASFASEDVIVEDIDVAVIGVNGSIICSTKKQASLPTCGLVVSPRTLEEAQFDVCTQKKSLDDRGTATLDVSLAIKWRRKVESSPINTSTLAVPRLLVSSSEPRVLAAVSYSESITAMIHFDVTIENPSNHFLTFGLTMEPSEMFAFSGVKQSTLQLVPLSRRTIKFRLLPSIRGDWIGPIHCVIKDRYFQKILKMAPTEGMKVDKEGILIWVPPEEEP
ncbi:Gryzun, putative trafficking through golgi-domain-containing protein [Amylocarpus encephaloides]|uniref:Gryzun, putative trafficking through golgi-domain-containing protein n=1 Tax=Amylocarpus encephaloides TaxID=45428 RepID=A0A9P7YTH8_9HELO|nr:Gryzun, putative trafficking through golgi-domain-containing protein [Amylocarpus encephaloides]